MEKKNFGSDLTEGSIPRHLLSIAVPMLLGNLINSGYSIVDAIWIGRVVGKSAMGAVAVSFPVIFIFVAVAAGATMATTILISQFYGAKNYIQVKRTVGTSFTLAMILGVLLSFAGVMLTDKVLTLLGTPASIQPEASSYLKISFFGFPLIYMSFLITSILRGIGDTKTPLLFMTAGVIVNAILDPLLILGVGPFPYMGLNGAALASVISSFIAMMMGMIYLNVKGNVVAFHPRMIALKKDVVFLIFKIGFPSMLQQSAVSLGLAAVTSYVNKFGDAATAAFGAAGRIDQVSFFPAMSIGMAVSAIAGQNLGAKKIDRVRETFKWGVLMTVSISVFMSIFFVAMPKTLLQLFINDPDVIKIGVSYLRIVGPSSVMFAIMFVSNGIINGAGHTMTTLFFTLFALWGVRVPAAALLSKTSLGIDGVWLSFALGFAVIMVISLLYYRSGKWQKTVVRASFIPKEALESAITNEESPIGT